MQIKLAQDVLPVYEHAFRQVEFAQPAVKYDNRAFAVESAGGWATMKNLFEKITVSESEAPDNPAFEVLAEGYAAAFED